MNKLRDPYCDGNSVKWTFHKLLKITKANCSCLPIKQILKYSLSLLLSLTDKFKIKANSTWKTISAVNIGKNCSLNIPLIWVLELKDFIQRAWRARTTLHSGKQQYMDFQMKAGKCYLSAFIWMVTYDCTVMISSTQLSCECSQWRL